MAENIEDIEKQYKRVVRADKASNIGIVRPDQKHKTIFLHSHTVIPTLCNFVTRVHLFLCARA
jgi:hypothetical protein